MQHLIKAALLGEEDLGSLSDGDFDVFRVRRKLVIFLGRMLYVLTKRLPVRPQAQVSVCPGSSVRTPHKSF